MSNLPFNIGSRRELFVDDWLIETMQGCRLLLHKPERREVVMELDAPWEDSVAFPDRLLPTEDGWRFYYRAGILDWDREEDTYVLALAETRDGLTFTRPELGLCAFEGSTRNNILQIGGFPNVPPPFYDTNPACRPDQRYKGITARACEAYAMASPDGLRWSPLQEALLDLPGQFDTVNTSFWDSAAGCYRCFTRSWHDLNTGRVLEKWNFGDAHAIRAIQQATSPDFLHWSAPEQLHYDDGDSSIHLYTNAILPCPGAEHLYLGFPSRYVPERKFDPSHQYEGVNDALFMSSRDGVHWKRWRDAWVRPGTDALNWTERNNYPLWGIAETSPTEWSLYISEHYRHPGMPTRLRRLTVRPWGFVSVHADYTGGELLTRPFLFTGNRLHLNFSTSAAGYVRVTLCDEGGKALPGFDGAEMTPCYGDSIDAEVTWGERAEVAAFQRRPVRLRVELKDADLFTVQFRGSR
ncbi:MAG: hypothetical protein ACYC7E_18285 [Armatimonadota bacterium]